MSVAAIIPTTGRPELVRAVRSVLDQTVDVAPVVVLDRPDRAAAVVAQLELLPHRLVMTNGGEGGAAARNRGVSEAASDVVAFLDDDDEWTPGKTREQLAMLAASPEAVIASRARLVGASVREVPEVLYSNSRSMADYLLDRSTVHLRKHFMQSSTLMMARRTAIALPWIESLPRHQDWTLLIKAREQGVPVLTHPEVLVSVHQGSTGSVSMSRNWKASEEWVDVFGADASRTSRGDFLLSVVLRSAIADQRPAQAMRIFAKALRHRPHVAAVVVGASALVPKRRRH